MQYFNFDPEKAQEVILFIASKANNKGYYNIMKILYLSDKLHLERYGRFINGDRYVAMLKGPVPSETYDIIKDVSKKRETRFNVEHSFEVVNKHQVVPTREPNFDYLSDSDIECLEETIAKYNNLSIKAIKDDSHDQAWEKQFYSSPNQAIDINSIVDILPNKEQLHDYLRVNFG